MNQRWGIRSGIKATINKSPWMDDHIWRGRSRDFMVRSLVNNKGALMGEIHIYI